MPAKPYAAISISTHAPAGGATHNSKPCYRIVKISTHAPAGGATRACAPHISHLTKFLLTPLREGRLVALVSGNLLPHFYSRPCGRGDIGARHTQLFRFNFYSRPCGRGDLVRIGVADVIGNISTHAPAGGATEVRSLFCVYGEISTHAPAGGATAIFHKSVMRFCGKLPKDDTVLCLASFGFPRRDPKAVYLAWISCANLPQKCVREGLALKDQGTSCFHEGLASHAFDPVLV